MSTHPVPELMRLWRRGELTAEQATGHMLQHLLALFEWRREVEKRLAEDEQRIHQLEQRLAAKP